MASDCLRLLEETGDASGSAFCNCRLLRGAFFLKSNRRDLVGLTTERVLQNSLKFEMISKRYKPHDFQTQNVLNSYIRVLKSNLL